MSGWFDLLVAYPPYSVCRWVIHGAASTLLFQFHPFAPLNPSPFVPNPVRHLPTIVHRTTVQSITITSRKEDIKEEEQRNRTEPPPAPAVSPSTPTFSSPLSPPAQPSFLASLLARKRSTVTVPATKEVSPPSRGSCRPTLERLPYMPQSPFHLFSYDLDEEPSPPAAPKPSQESPKAPSPRSGRTGELHLPRHREAQKAFPCSSPIFYLYPFNFHFAFLAFGFSPPWISLHLLCFFITFTLHQFPSLLRLNGFTPSACQPSYYHLLFPSRHFFPALSMRRQFTPVCNIRFVPQPFASFHHLVGKCAGFVTCWIWTVFRYEVVMILH